MRVIPPTTITPAMLTATNVAEPSAGETAWASGTTYALNDQVVSATTHRTYQSLQAANTNHDPTTSPTWWQDIGPSNRWKMFDLLRSTGTANPGSIVVTLTPGVRFDSIGVVGLVADSILIEQKKGATVIWSSGTINLLNRPTTGWYSYFFGKFRYRSVVAFFDLKADSGTTVTITITKATGNAVCGGVVLGMNVYLGATQHSAENDATNFSKIDRDIYGTATLIPRRSVPKNTLTLRIKKKDVDAILAARDDLNAVPALWSGLDDQDSGYFAALLIVGVYKQFKVSMDQPDDALVTLEIEEV